MRFVAGVACVANAGDEWITHAEAARVLGVSDETVRRMVRRRLLSVRRIPGGKPRVSRAEVKAMAAASIVAAEEGPLAGRAGEATP